MLVNNEGLIELDKKVILKPYVPRELKPRTLMTDIDIINNAGGTLFLDCEVYPNYFCCGFKLLNKDLYLSLECGQDRFNPKMLSWIMNSYKTIGFNSIKYDLLRPSKRISIFFAKDFSCRFN